MSPDNKKKKSKPEETVEKAPESQTADTEISENEKKYADLNDKYLRLLAEYDNYRKRTQAEKEGIYTDAFAQAVAHFLPVFDNLDRAVAASDGEGLKAGLALVMKQIGDIYEKIGVAEIPALNCPFDPVLHDAVLHVEDDEHDPNTVIEVLQKGYSVKNRIVRHAMVKVAN